MVSYSTMFTQIFKILLFKITKVYFCHYTIITFEKNQNKLFESANIYILIQGLDIL